MATGTELIKLLIEFDTIVKGDGSNVKAFFDSFKTNFENLQKASEQSSVYVKEAFKQIKEEVNKAEITKNPLGTFVENVQEQNNQLENVAQKVGNELAIITKEINSFGQSIKVTGLKQVTTDLEELQKSTSTIKIPELEFGKRTSAAAKEKAKALVEEFVTVFKNNLTNFAKSGSLDDLFNIDQKFLEKNKAGKAIKATLAELRSVVNKNIKDINNITFDERTNVLNKLARAFFGAGEVIAVQSKKTRINIEQAVELIGKAFSLFQTLELSIPKDFFKPLQELIKKGGEDSSKLLKEVLNLLINEKISPEVGGGNNFLKALGFNQSEITKEFHAINSVVDGEIKKLFNTIEAQVKSGSGNLTEGLAKSLNKVPGLLQKIFSGDNLKGLGVQSGEVKQLEAALQTLGTTTFSSAEDLVKFKTALDLLYKILAKAPASSLQQALVLLIEQFDTLKSKFNLGTVIQEQINLAKKSIDSFVKEKEKLEQPIQPFKPSDLLQKDTDPFEKARTAARTYEERLASLDEIITRTSSQLKELTRIQTQLGEGDTRLQPVAEQLLTLKNNAEASKNVIQAAGESWQNNFKKLIAGTDLAKKSTTQFFESLKRGVGSANDISKSLEQAGLVLNSFVQTKSAPQNLEDIYKNLLKLGSTSQEAASKLITLGESVRLLFQDFGKGSALGGVLNIEEFKKNGEVTDQLRQKLIELANGINNTNNAYNRLLNLSDQLNALGLGTTPFGQQVKELADIARGAENYSGQLRNLSEQTKKAKETSNALENTLNKLQGTLTRQKNLEANTPEASQNLQKIQALTNDYLRQLTNLQGKTTELGDAQRNLNQQQAQFSSENGVVKLEALSNSLITLTQNTENAKKRFKELSKGATDQGIGLESLIENVKISGRTLEQELQKQRVRIVSEISKVYETLSKQTIPVDLGNNLAAQLKRQLNESIDALRGGDLTQALVQVRATVAQFNTIFEQSITDPKLITPAQVDALIQPLAILTKTLELERDKFSGARRSLEEAFGTSGQIESLKLLEDLRSVVQEVGGSAGVASQGISVFRQAVSQLLNLLREAQTAGLQIDTTTSREELTSLQHAASNLFKYLSSTGQLTVGDGLRNDFKEADNILKQFERSAKTSGSGIDSIKNKMNAFRAGLPDLKQNLESILRDAFKGDLLKINTSQFTAIGKQIRQELAVTTDVKEKNNLTQLLEQYKELIPQVRAYNAAVNAGTKPGTGVSAFLDRTTTNQTISQLNTLTGALEQVRQQLINVSKSGQLTVESARQLILNFANVESRFKDLGTQAGTLTGDVANLDRVIATLGTGAKAQELAQPLIEFRDQIKAAIQERDALEKAFKRGFTASLETDLNRLVRANELLTQSTEIGQRFTKQDYFEQTARGAGLAYEEIQRLTSALRTVNTGLDKSLSVQHISSGAVNPELVAQLTAQKSAIEESIKVLTSYNQVYDQLRSSTKIDIFERLKTVLNQLYTGEQTRNLVDYERKYRDFINNLQISSSTIKNPLEVLTQGLVNNFKIQSQELKKSRTDLESWLQTLQNIQEVGRTTGNNFPVLNIAGKTVPVQDLINNFEKLLQLATNIQQPINEAANSLDTRLSTAAGRAELKISELQERYALLQRRLNEGGAANQGFQGTFATVQELLNLLNQPLKNNPLSQLRKEDLAPIRNQISAVRSETAALESQYRVTLNLLQASGTSSNTFKIWEKELKTVIDQLSVLDRGLNQLKAFETNASAFSPLKNDLHGAATNLNELAHEGAFLYKGLEKLFNSLAKNLAPKVEINTTSVEAKVKSLQEQFKLTEQQANQLKVAAKEALNQQVGNGGLAAANQYKQAFEELEKAFVKFHSGLSQAAMGFQMLGDSLLEPFKKAKENFETFSDTMGAVNAVTNATAREFDALTQQALLMGATTRFTAEQAAEGLKALAKAGFTAQEQIATLPAVMRLAQAAATELATAAQIATVVMNEFQMDPEQFTQASDAIALAANRTLASVEDLGFSFKYVGALAANIGADFNQLTASIATLHNAGLRGTLAGTALRGILQRLYNPTKQNAEVLDELSRRIGGAGLQIQDASGNFIGFSKIVQQLEQAGITTGEVLKVFGQRAGPGMAALLAQGSDALIKLEKDLDNAAGTTAHMAEIMEGTLKGKLLLMRSAFQALADDVGHNLSGTLEKAADVIADFVSSFVALRKEFPILSSALDHILGGLALFASVLGGMAVTFAFMVVPVRQFLAFLKTLIVTTLAGAGAITSQAAAFAFNAKAVDITNKALVQAVVAEYAAAQASGNLARIKTVETGIRNLNIRAIQAEVTALLGNVAAQRTAAATSGSLLTGLKNIAHLFLVSVLNIGKVLRFAFTTPLGLALTALTALVTATYLHGKSTTQVNEELKKQNELLEYSKNEAVGLSEALVNTASDVKRLNNEYSSLFQNDLALDTPEARQVKIELDIKKDKLNQQLKELFTRLSEDTSRLKNKVSFDVAIDDEGTFTDFKINVDGATETIDVFANGIGGVVDQLKKLTPELERVADAQKNLNSQQQLGNSLRDKLGAGRSTVFGERGNITDDLKRLIGIKPQIEEARQNIEKYKGLIESLTNSLENYKARNVSRFSPFKYSEEFLTEFRGVINKLKNKLSSETLRINDILDQAGQEVITALSKELNLSENELSKLPNLEKIVTEKLTLKFKKENISFDEFDAVQARLLKKLKDLATTTSSLELSSEPFRKPFNEIVSAVTDFEKNLSKKNEELKKLIKEQEGFFNNLKPVIDAADQYRKAFVDFDKQDFELKTKTLEFDIQVNKDKILTELTQQIEQLTVDSKVVDLPFSIKPEFITTDSSLLRGVESISSIVLNYEKSINAELIKLQLEQAAKEYEAVTTSEKAKQKAIRESLSAIRGFYQNRNAEFYKLEQEKVTALVDSLKTEYEATKTHLDKLYALRAGLIQKNQQLDNAYTSRQAEAASNLQKLYLSDKSDKEKRQFLTTQIKALKELADEASSTGNLDRAKALLDQQQQLITQAINEVAGNENASFLDKYFLKKFQEQNLEDTSSVINQLKSEGESAQATLTSQIEANKTKLKELATESSKLGTSLENSLKNLKEQSYLDIGITPESYKRIEAFVERYKEAIREMNASVINVALRDATPEKVIEATKAQKEASERQSVVAKQLAQIQKASQTLDPFLKTQGVANSLKTVSDNIIEINNLLENRTKFESEDVDKYEKAVQAAQTQTQYLFEALEKSNIDPTSDLYKNIVTFINKINGLKVGDSLRQQFEKDNEGTVAQFKTSFLQLKTESDATGKNAGKKLSESYIQALTESVPILQKTLNEALASGDVEGLRDIFKRLQEAITQTKDGIDKNFDLEKQGILSKKSLDNAKNLLKIFRELQETATKGIKATIQPENKQQPSVDNSNETLSNYENINKQLKDQKQNQKIVNETVIAGIKSSAEQALVVVETGANIKQLTTETSNAVEKSNLLKDAWVAFATAIFEGAIPEAKAATDEIENLQGVFQKPVKESTNINSIFSSIEKTAKNTYANILDLTSQFFLKASSEKIDFNQFKIDSTAVLTFKTAEDQINSTKDAVLDFLLTLPKIKTESGKLKIFEALKETTEKVVNETKSIVLDMLKAVKDKVEEVIYLKIKVDKEKAIEAATDGTALIKQTLQEKINEQSSYQLAIKISDQNIQKVQDTLLSGLNILNEYTKPRMVDIRYVYRDENRIEELTKKLKELRNQQPQGFFKEPLIDNAEIQQIEKLLLQERSKPVLLDVTDAKQKGKELHDELAKPITVNVTVSEAEQQLTELKAKEKVLKLNPEINKEALQQLTKDIKTLEDKVIQLKIKKPDWSIIQPLSDESIIQSGKISEKLKTTLNEVKQFDNEVNKVWSSTSTKKGVQFKVDTVEFENDVNKLKNKINVFTDGTERNWTKTARRLTATGLGIDGKQLEFPIANFRAKANTWEELVSEGNRYMRLTPQIAIDPKLKDQIQDVRPIIQPEVDTVKVNSELDTQIPKKVSVTIDSNTNQIDQSIKDVVRNTPPVEIPAVVNAVETTKLDDQLKDKKEIKLVVTGEDLAQKAVNGIKQLFSDLTKTSVIPVKTEIKGVEEIAVLTTQLVNLTTTPFTTIVNAITDQATSALSNIKNILDSIQSKQITVTVNYEQVGSPSVGANSGGLIPQIQKFAHGGLSSKFKKLTSSFIPGSGNQDTVPAMLTPGEFVIKKDRVAQLGVGFLNALNNGLIQLKSAGGVIANAPINTLNAVANNIPQSISLPQTAQTSGGPPVDIRLTIDKKPFNIKTPREESRQLVDALKRLERGL